LFLLFSITIFPGKAQNKIKQSQDQDDFVLMMTIHKAKTALHKFTFVSGGTKGFLKSSKQQTY